MQNYDFLVIGSGPAGQKAAVQAAKLGKRVAIIERQAEIGGVSVHTGTIPSKTLREAVLYLTGWDQRGLYGRSYRLKENLTIEDLMQRLHITLNHETEVMSHQLSRNGVTVIQGEASFIDEHTLQVERPGGKLEGFHGEKILIAVGSRPVRPEGVPFESESVVDSDGILDIKEIPKSMIIVGGGVIGVEYASIFSAMDVKVTLIDGRERLLDFLDRELADELVHHMRDRGVMLRLSENIDRVEEKEEGKIVAHLESGKQVSAELILFAAGRIGCTYALNLHNAGIEPDSRRRIKVNEFFQTEVPHIYAGGDVIGFPSLASTSMEQGRIAACHAFGKSACQQSSDFPFGIYAVPEISMIGRTEQQLTKEQIPYEVGLARLRETARGQIMGLEDGVLKILFSSEDRRVLGVHILGEGATELIHIGQAVMLLSGTLDYFIENVFNYPTLAEAYKVAALDAYNRLNG
ncbi:NAD(P)(+) transhydrogenase [Solemya pervernicosa gill symbiont]|uniref:Soluble pyridine nucleotide transhydrogenase n=2 Tax=Gammaproteobacteria incertae sedis TaxID=118884 RepID=A0A1T2L907_9GAMM|nr:Si-specific NAD(P)(+) transhydrogenase [Candidatus Reidiella endopervernicosa]OOZ41550.1 NAD(P)(+) transhydrogenase [Solemya pervernicosa gill symbiont]QKQ27958.1 Si-specific NAD(P)(+) transhydrogenase [Candidatus Reidiella endopervernicosa]